MTDTQRKHIQDWIEDVQTTDSYDIGQCQLNWLSSRQEWQLILPNKEILTEDCYNGVGDLLAHIDDADILDYYPTIAQHYEESNECPDIPAELKEAAE
ncbi:hypothetical protein UFOVP322_33 [uncultured Caudovirales phage]|uniref:Uncharacterized protein n=1 Tax=uncultured Caudovirales phage TaxID=2100421 RepID=A0A6J5NTQ0_9CAUD|nr:hypothetical protein UFOVP322_33 [uncultured Caudovirales phage]CAB4161036.1 hypothetical protein UFOVP771_31 [uncultured Caudovirales phage]CAB4166449.1 hypothetical protein UFOVP850_31 [uncultured Caudovirales phage]